MYHVFKNIKTTTDSENLQSEILMLLDSFYQDQGRQFDNLMKGKVRAWVKDSLYRDFGKGGVERQDVLKSILDALTKFKAIKLKLAFEPTQNVIDSVFEFVNKGDKERYLLDISYEPRIIAGVVIIKDGSYYDFSIAKLVDEEFMKRRREILGFLEMNVES